MRESEVSKLAIGEELKVRGVAIQRNKIVTLIRNQS